MGICSYLVFPKSGKRQALVSELAQLPGCDVLPADNHDELMVLVTETNTPDEEALLQESLKEVEDIQCMALTFGDVSMARGDEE